MRNILLLTMSRGGKLMIEKTYRVKLKNGETVMEIAGDKKFVTRSFGLLKPVFVRALSQSKAQRTTRQKRKKSEKKTAPAEIITEPEPTIEPVPEPEPFVVQETSTPPAKPIGTDLGKLTLSELFKVKNPQIENHRVLLLAFYANQNLKKEEFKGVDLERLYSELNMPAPKNLSNFLRRMAENQEGLVVFGSKHGRYKITEKGAEFIRNEIPTV